VAKEKFVFRRDTAAFKWKVLFAHGQCLGQHTMRRGSFLNIKRTTSQGALYQSCYKHIEDKIRDPDHSSGTANQIRNAEKVDPLGNMDGQVAHLLSHAPVCYRAYPFLAEAAIGIKIEKPSPTRNVNTNQLIKTLEPTGNMKINQRKLLVGVKGRHHCTSLKGHKYNKMYLKQQQVYFDTENPSMLVVLLLSLDE
jgi:hypothetical protein